MDAPHDETESTDSVDLIDESIMDQAREMAAAIGDPFVMLRATLELLAAAPSETLTDPELTTDVIRL